MVECLVGGLKGWGLDLKLGWNDWRFDRELGVGIELWVGNWKLRLGWRLDEVKIGDWRLDWRLRIRLGIGDCGLGSKQEVVRLGVEMGTGE
jgi:hypothetical protein